MTITVSVEELRAHERACKEWVERNLQKELFQHLLKANLKEDYDARKGSLREWLETEIKIIDEHLKNHPIPKLIPAV